MKDTPISVVEPDTVALGGAMGQALRAGARNAIVHQGRLGEGVRLITKPFTYADLAARVRDVLDEAPV